MLNCLNKQLKTIINFKNNLKKCEKEIKNHIINL